MACTADAIIDEVLALPEAERARVVDALIIEAMVASELEQDPTELRAELEECRAPRKTA